jgi:Transglycosylase SLT domain
MKNPVLIFPLLLGISISARAQDALTGFSAPKLTERLKRGDPTSRKSSDPNVGRYILAAASKYELDPLFVLEVIRQESHFRTDAVSRAGAQGIAQLMPATAARLGVNPFDPVEAIDGGCRILRDLLLRYKGRMDLALAAYNAGENAVDAYLYGVSKCCTTKGGMINPKKIKTDGIPPYKETQAYVGKIISAYTGARDLLLARGWNPEKVGIKQVSSLIPRQARNASPVVTAQGVSRETEELLDDFSAMTEITWRTSQQTWIDTSERGPAESVPDTKPDVVWKTGDLRRSSRPKQKEIEP